jgi:hypothetical protein
MGIPTEELVHLIKTCGLNRVAMYAPFLSVHIKAAQSDPRVLGVLQSCRKILYTRVSLNADDEAWAYDNGLPITVLFMESERGIYILMNILCGPCMVTYLRNR